MKYNNQNGQAFIEALAISFLFFILLSIICTLAYHNMATHWLRQNVYESGLCIIMNESQADCKQRLERKTKNLIPFGKIVRLQYKHKKNKYLKIYCKYQINERFSYEVEHKINLPLDPDEKQ